MTMKLVKAMFGGLMLAAAPLAALADDMSYSYVDLAYVETDIDQGPTADGFALRGSVGFAENWFAFGEYADQSVSGVDLTQYAVGIGGHYGLAESLDLVGRVGWAKVEIDAGFVDAAMAATRPRCSSAGASTSTRPGRWAPSSRAATTWT
jgi:hypothetical protein